jgi:hypothetical protein
MPPIRAAVALPSRRRPQPTPVAVGPDPLSSPSRPDGEDLRREIIPKINRCAHLLLPESNREAQMNHNPPKTTRVSPYAAWYWAKLDETKVT